MEVRSRKLTVEEWLALNASLGDRSGGIPLEFAVTGYSMYPFLRSGRDRVTVLPVQRALRVGDIVLFPAKSARADYMLHRIVRKKGDWILTQGDRNPTPDFWMPADRVLGIAVRLERGDRVIHPQAASWRMAARIWMALRPVRPFLLRQVPWAAKLVRRGAAAEETEDTPGE